MSDLGKKKREWLVEEPSVVPEREPERESPQPKRKKEKEPVPA